MCSRSLMFESHWKSCVLREELEVRRGTLTKFDAATGVRLLPETEGGWQRRPLLLEFLPILPFVPDLRDDVEENHGKHLQRFR